MCLNYFETERRWRIIFKSHTAFFSRGNLIKFEKEKKESLFTLALKLICSNHIKQSKCFEWPLLSTL